MELDRQGSMPIWDQIHTDQGALRTHSKNFSGLKILKCNYPGDRSAKIRVQMGPANSVKKFLWPENFERQLTWSPIDKAQRPHVHRHMPAGQWVDPVGQWVDPVGQWVDPVGPWVDPVGQWVGPAGRPSGSLRIYIIYIVYIFGIR